ncbi:MAG: HD-GYP domain-containing protein [Chloroflexi bacterium]|nr:HD-GYP domain-containing protein [Chloroflexota bacterium]
MDFSPAGASSRRRARASRRVQQAIDGFSLLDEQGLSAAAIDLAARLVETEARAREMAHQIERMKTERHCRAAELKTAQDQLIAYATDIRVAFQAERGRNQLLERAYMQTVRTLACAIETRDPYTGGHVDRVARYARMLAEELGWGNLALNDLEIGALLHDTGKLGVPDAILRKPAPLNDEEWREMRRHPTIGAALVAGSAALRQARDTVLHHHERFDGRGYPDGLSGANIPIQARVVSVADAFDAMVTTRPYRLALPIDVALAELEQHAGSQFDPVCVAAFVEAARAGRLD